MNELKNCDFRENGLQDQSVDLIITDPPFFMKLDHFKTRTSFTRNFADLNVIEPFFRDMFDEIKRVMKSDGHFYIFCDGQSYPIFWYYSFFFTKSTRPLVWDKKTSFNGYSWRHQHELILFAEMPEAKPVPTGDGDILRFNAVPIKERIHPAQKPQELIETLIKKSSKEDDLVFDPFAGSNTTGKACKVLNRNYMGTEIDEIYYKKAIG